MDMHPLPRVPPPSAPAGLAFPPSLPFPARSFFLLASCEGFLRSSTCYKGLPGSLPALNNDIKTGGLSLSPV